MLANGALQGDYAIDVYEYLLALNQEMFLAKFFRDNAGHIILGAETPDGQSASELVAWTIKAVIAYADRFGPLLRDGLAKQHQPVPPIREDDVFAMPLSRREEGLPASILSMWISTLNAEGWYQLREHVAQTWYLVYKPDYRSYNTFLTVTPIWTYFQTPLATFSARAMHEDPTLRALATRYLVRLNDVLYSAKLALNSSHQVILQLELPTGILDFTTFLEATRTLAKCLTLYDLELNAMATLDEDAQLANLLTTYQQA
jgi:hypothetical protein